MYRLRLGDYVKIRTGKLDANKSCENGKYPFFTCAIEPLKIDNYAYDLECILVAGNGDLNVKYYNGKFNAYQRTYIIESLNQEVLLVKYLFHFMEFYISTLRHESIGGVIKYIKLNNLTDAKIPILSIMEQNQIIQRLELVATLINIKKRKIVLLDSLIRSRFLELFGDPLAGNAKWPIHNLCMVADAIDPQPSHRAPPIDKNGIPYISIKDCDYNTGKIDFEKARKVNVKVLQEQKTKYQIHNGDMMIGKIGTIGYPVFLPTYETYTLSANVILIQPNKSKVQPCFLKYSLESPYVESQFDKAKHSTSQSAFGILKIRKIKVMNPELSIQNQFADFVNQVDKSKYQEVSVTGWRGILICCNI